MRLFSLFFITLICLTPFHSFAVFGDGKKTNHTRERTELLEDIADATEENSELLDSMKQSTDRNNELLEEQNELLKEQNDLLRAFIDSRR